MACQSVLSMTAIFEYFKESKILRKGENSVISGFVNEMLFDNELSTIRGKVHASMKNKIYKVEIILSGEEIIQCSCDCPKGLDVCHHMCALAIFAHKNLSVTDVACKWTKPKVSKDDISMSKTVEECFPPATTHHFKLLEDISIESVNDLKEDLKKCGPTGLGWLLLSEPTSDSYDLVIDIEKFICSEEYMKSEDQSNFLKENLRISPENILKIQTATIGQSSNPTWLVVRKHRLTASNFGRVLKSSRRSKFPPSLFQTLSGNTNLDGIKQIQWGRSNEPVALSKFEAIHHKQVHKSGLWLHPCGILGASPDALLDNNILLEVKCPYKFREDKFRICLLNNKNYIISFDGEKYNVNKDHDYYHQIQGQLMLSGRNKCILILWSTNDYLEILIEKEITWTNNINILYDFYFNIYLNYLLNPDSINNKQLN